MEVRADGEDGCSGVEEDVGGVRSAQGALAVPVFEEAVALLGEVVVGAVRAASTGVDDGPDDAGAGFKVFALGVDDGTKTFVAEGERDFGASGAGVSPDIGTADGGGVELDQDFALVDFFWQGNLVEF